MTSETAGRSPRPIKGGVVCASTYAPATCLKHDRGTGFVTSRKTAWNGQEPKCDFIQGLVDTAWAITHGQPRAGTHEIMAGTSIR